MALLPSDARAGDRELARPSLDAVGRCARTGNRMAGQCIGHWDYFGTYMVWTRHLVSGVDWRVVRYPPTVPDDPYDEALSDACHY